MDWGVAVLALALGLAAWLLPWARAAEHPPAWPWLALWMSMPLLWSADRLVAVPLLQPLSLAPLLVLGVGWPLTMLALVPVAAALVLVAGLPVGDALQRTLWLGVVPGTLALVCGVLVDRLLPRQLFVYLFGRVYFGTAAAVLGAGVLAWALAPTAGVVASGDVLIARVLMASGEAVLTGMLVAVFVAFRPEWLASYSDRTYLGGGSGGNGAV